MKVKKSRTFKRLSLYETDLADLIKNKESFSEKSGNHSASITMLDGSKTLYADKKVNPVVFGLGKRLKKEIDPYLYEFENSFDIGYFLINDAYEENYIFGNSEGNFSRTYNIDISSAYLSALYNSGKISNELYKKINCLKKSDRLVCLGLLAYEPFIKTYVKGKIVHAERIKSDYRHVFFYCIKVVFQLSKKIKLKLGEDFLFSWVDGFYFTNEANINVIQDFLRSKKFNFKLYRLFNFSQETPKKFVKFSYRKRDKNKKGKEILRKVNIVVPKNQNTRDMTEFFQINEDLDEGDYSSLEKKIKSNKL